LWDEINYVPAQVEKSRHKLITKAAERRKRELCSKYTIARLHLHVSFRTAIRPTRGNELNACVVLFPFSRVADIDSCLCKLEYRARRGQIEEGSGETSFVTGFRSESHRGSGIKDSICFMVEISIIGRTATLTYASAHTYNITMRRRRVV